MIIFGGPQVPDNAEEFLRLNSFIDIVVHNEGERTFMSIVDGYPICDWSELSGVSYLSDQNTFVSTPPTPRIRDLSEVPSPFLNGVLDKIVADNPDEKWIGL